MKQIVFFATEWGPYNGGINAFNYDLANAISRKYSDKIQVICYVEKSDIAQAAEALDNNIRLYFIGKQFDLNDTEHIINSMINNKFLDIISWIGHDVITGDIAIACKEKYNEKLDKNSISAIIHHMNYRDYYTTKSNNAQLTYVKENQQKKLIKESDLIFAVGPYLKDSAESFLKELEILDKDVIELIPGLHNLKNIKLNNNFNVLTYGRLDGSDEIVKQGHLAVAAFASYCKNEIIRKSKLNIIGFKNDNIEEKHKELIEYARKYSGQLCDIQSYPYLERESIYSMLKVQNVCMVLSTHEGFGLTGWEAISAEVPLILSVDTGLYKFLEAIGGHVTGCIYPVKIYTDLEKDIHNISNALLDIKNNLEKYHNNAAELKNNLNKYTWEYTAEEFISQIIVKSKVNLILKEPVFSGVQSNNDTVSNNLPIDKSNNNKMNDFINHQIDIKSDILYSATTKLSYKIAERYYENKHYVWCTESFNPSSTNPESANPFHIYKKFQDEIDLKTDSKIMIRKHKSGLIHGARENFNKGLINKKQLKEIESIIAAAGDKYYKPIIYIISTGKVKNKIKSVSRNKKGDFFSKEYLIESLEGEYFEVIDLN